MKKYVTPEMNIVVLAVEDVITASIGDNEVGVGDLFSKPI